MAGAFVSPGGDGQDRSLQPCARVAHYNFFCHTRKLTITNGQQGTYFFLTIMSKGIYNDGFSEISAKMGNKKPLGEESKRAKRVLRFIPQLRSSGYTSWGTLKSLSFTCEGCHSADAPTCQKGKFNIISACGLARGGHNFFLSK
jgi:hypothetical protein